MSIPTRYLIPALVAVCDAETMASLGIHTASQLSGVFESSDLDGDHSLSASELTSFESSARSEISNYWLMAPFEVVLYAEEGCTGHSLAVNSSSFEQRCENCFDVCGKSFSGGTSMASASTSRSSGFVSQVQSVQVTQGAVHVDSKFCFGTYNFGFNMSSSGRVVGEKDGCVNIQEAAHVAALSPVVLETVSLYFLKEDEGPDFDHALNTSEASDLVESGLFYTCDRNQDEVLTTSEYLEVLAFDMAASTAFMSADSMKDAAAVALGPEGDSATESAKAALALEAFGHNFEDARADPAVGTLTTPSPYNENGQLIVTAGSGAPVEYGAVDDTSRVAGVYDPQNGGEVSMCTEGRQFQSRFCYESCREDYPVAVFNLCYKEHCPEGFVEMAGGVCKEPGFSIKTTVKESYNRGQGVLPDKCTLSEADSFGPGVQEDNLNRDFTMIITSDPQLPWCSGEFKSDMACAKIENWRLVQAMHQIESLRWEKGIEEDVAKPVGVMITGDLTAYAHENQIQEYRKIWETREREDPDKNIKLPVWPGLGNHDYSNNLNACYFLDEELTWAGYGGVSSCAQRMIAYIRTAVTKCNGKTVVPNFGGFVDHYDHDSAAYTVKYGKIRFVHLHNYPTFRREELTGVASTLGFLKEEVEWANRTGDYLVLMIHDIGNKFGYTYNEDRMEYVQQILAGSRTLAMFAGHWHPMGGQVRGYETLYDVRDELGKDDRRFLPNAWGEQMEIVRGWAPDYAKFLVTQWDLANCQWRFGSVNVSTDGVPRWHQPGEARHMRNFTIPNCTVDGDYQPPDPGFAGAISSAFRNLGLFTIAVCVMLRI